MQSTPAPAAAQARSSRLDKRFWLDVTVFEFSILWLPSWTPRGWMLGAVSMVVAAGYVEWTRRQGEYIWARFLLAATLVLPMLGVISPAWWDEVNFGQILLLTAAGFASMKR